MDVLKRLARQAGTGAEAVLGAAMAIVIALNALVIAKAGRGWPFGLGVGIVICATALLRGRNRAWAAMTGLVLFAAAGLAVALGAVPPGPLFGGGLVGLLVLGAAAVRTLPPRLAAVIGVGGTLVIGVSETAGPHGLFDNRVYWALAGATLWSAALAVGLYLRYLDFLHRETLATVRREERLELARELHDVVAHHVTGMVVQAQAARFAGKDHAETLRSALGSVETAGAETLAAIRQLVGLLRDPDDTGGVPPTPEPISRLVERFAEHGPVVDLRLPPAPAWPPEVASTVYRVVQEALTNITRHAPGARSVTVTVTHDPQQVRVEVIDNAPATASRHSRPTGGYGLVGMRERVEALGGRLRAGPLPEAGWAVQASLPVPAQGRP
ncbi:sensor histidine kinase [Actinoallomurus sp. CA-150999]|uniref:sensor histidine kinase n=1 Tax=Actinoallomurus sp. CA-150999 TaxID=3239887 RepID=UPI003D8E857C